MSSGRGSRVVWVLDRGLPCHEFEPSTTKDPPSDPEQGSWESGLSYECRTLLFKSLHNLVERSLLSKGHYRLGKWFIDPFFDDNGKSIKSQQLSFCLNFFIHGESTVCVSVDVRQRIPVCPLTRQHLSIAQGTHNGLKVILCPYGMAGTLTGQSYKDTDLTIQRFLSEWNHFYPVRSKKERPSDDDHIMAAVEVIVGGIRMRYPSSYILVSEVDENAAIGSNANVSQFSSFNNSSSSFCASQQKASLLTGVLTPPTSPCDPTLAANCTFRGASSDIVGDNSGGNSVYTTSWKIKEAVWQDSALQGRRQNVEGNDQAGIWDFSDPSSLVRCDCSRSKIANQEKTNTLKVPTSTSSSSPALTTSSPAASVDSPSSSTSANCAANAARKNDKPDKLKQQTRYRTSIPFHKRSAFSDSSEMENYVSSSAFAMASMPGSSLPNSVNTNFQFKGLNQSLRSSTPSGLPQLHTSVVQPSSPLPDTPMTDGTNSQSAELAMPTLSPHPPAIKDEEDEEEIPTESQDQKLAVKSPTSSTQEANNNENSKETVLNEQVRVTV
ncbi:mediator of RNA polymerase II transcription subunit 13-like [Trichonephila clavipes]|nr:mediator of RNA polymerase II transcription subunit 13-like [Trichonephila clavipes]